eukprot:maker-scaffold82_size396747-snap-gene-2.25 protein:Tk06836 transcript:maker-scaffold82_size396747-snap-gene-2.25-mRNA-1 annotation:"endo- -beta-xylanase a precursor"
MRGFQVVASLICLGLARGSLFPQGETEGQWNQRIQANIDLNRKTDVQVKVQIPDHLRGRSNIRLLANQSTPTFPLGTALSANRIANCWNAGDDDAYCSFARDNFNYAVAENGMKWWLWENEYNNYNTYDVDTMFKWLKQKGWGIRGHCLFWDVGESFNFPNWVFGLRGQELIDAVHHRIDNAVPYFKGRIQHWDVNNEMLHGNFFAESSYDPDIRVKMFQWIEEQDSNVILFVNDYNVLLYETEEYINHIHDLLNKGANIRGIGIQAHLGPEVIDLAKIEDALDRFWYEFHIQMWITEFDWNGDVNGDHNQHATELINFYNLAMSHEGVQGIMMWGYCDQVHWRPEAAIANGNDCTPNKAGLAYIDLYYNSYRTKTAMAPSSVLDAELVFDFKGFEGEYKLDLVDESGRIVHPLGEAHNIKKGSSLEL